MPFLKLSSYEDIQHYIECQLLGYHIFPMRLTAHVMGRLRQFEPRFTNDLLRHSPSSSEWIIRSTDNEYNI